jgi:hypothetical protein
MKPQDIFLVDEFKQYVKKEMKFNKQKANVFNQFCDTYFKGKGTIELLKEDGFKVQMVVLIKYIGLMLQESEE